MPVSLPLFDPAVWRGVVADIAAALGVKPAKVLPASRLVQDVGMC